VVGDNDESFILVAVVMARFARALDAGIRHFVDHCARYGWLLSDERKIIAKCQRGGSGQADDTIRRHITNAYTASFGSSSEA
jgi:hypothetical protein